MGAVIDRLSIFALQEDVRRRKERAEEEWKEYEEIRRSEREREEEEIKQLRERRVSQSFFLNSLKQT